jgi:hypothetical protein
MTYQYMVPSRLFLALCGDIESNPRPIRNLLKDHPIEHKQRNHIYFTPNTIQLRPEYQQLSTKFAPHLDPTHLQHREVQQSHLFLSRFISRHNHYPPLVLLYALIVNISLIPAKCNILLFQPSPLIPNLLQRLSLRLQNPNNTLLTQHTYNQFLINNHELISLPLSIHTKLYDHIIYNNPPASYETTKTSFPYLPDILIREALNCTQPLIGYIQQPQTTIPLPQRTNNNNYTSNATYFITWNVSSLNTSLPCLQSLIDHHMPTIITLQETKLTSKKSPKHLQRTFLQYKLIFINQQQIRISK